VKFLKSTFGYFLASIIINGCWGFFTNKFGILGGYAAAFFLTGSMWYINHYKGLISHDEDSAFIDMGLGVAVCLVTKGYVLNGVSAVISSMPTFVCVGVGAVFGGLAAILIEKSITEKNIIQVKSKKESFETINLRVAD
jgi:hypothetical protein